MFEFTRKKHNSNVKLLAFHVVQSFKKCEVTPEQAQDMIGMIVYIDRADVKLPEIMNVRLYDAIKTMEAEGIEKQGTREYHCNCKSDKQPCEIKKALGEDELFAYWQV